MMQKLQKHSYGYTILKLTFLKHPIAKSTTSNLSSHLPKRFLVYVLTLLKLNSFDPNHPNSTRNIFHKIHPQFLHSLLMDTFNNLFDFWCRFDITIQNPRASQLDVLKSVLSIVRRWNFGLKIKKIIYTFGRISKYSCIILKSMNWVFLSLLSSCTSFIDNSIDHCL